MTRVVKRSRSDAPAGGWAAALAAMQKEYGVSPAKASGIEQPLRIPTGIFALDLALLGGIPMNRITKIVGNKHAGKTLLSDLVIGNYQKMNTGLRAVKIDIEGTHEPVWSSHLGVNQDELYVVQPETGEMAVDITDALIHTSEVGLIVVDSIATLSPMKELESSAEDAIVGLHARLIGSFVRKALAGLIAQRRAEHYITLLFINQFRSKIGGYAPPGIESLSEPGGKSLGFAYSVEITIKNKENKGKDSDGFEAMVENEHSFSITKNKLNNGPRSGEFRVRRVADSETGLGIGGIDDADTVLAYAKKLGLYTGGGSSWTLDFWDEEHKVANADAAIRLLYQNPEVFSKLKNYIYCEQAKRLKMPAEFYERFYPE